MFSMLILQSCTEKNETLLEGSAPLLAVRGPCGKHWFLRKAGRAPTARAFLAVLEFQGLAKAEEGSLLHRQNSNAAVSAWSLTWICNEGSKAAQEHSAVPHEKGFYSSNLCFCTKWEVGSCCRSSPWVTLSLLRMWKLPLYWDTSAIPAGRHPALPQTPLHRFLPCLLQVMGINLPSMIDFSPQEHNPNTSRKLWGLEEPLPHML